jgi:hypothetical protein
MAGPVHGNDFDTVQPQRPKDPQQLVAQFSSAVGGLSLYWRDQFFGRMEPNVPIRMNTFEVRAVPSPAQVGPQPCADV